jgi:hypothetical protein
LFIIDEKIPEYVDGFDVGMGVLRSLAGYLHKAGTGWLLP